MAVIMVRDPLNIDDYEPMDAFRGLIVVADENDTNSMLYLNDAINGGMIVNGVGTVTAHGRARYITVDGFVSTVGYLLDLKQSMDVELIKQFNIIRSIIATAKYLKNNPINSTIQVIFKLKTPPRMSDDSYINMNYYENLDRIIAEEKEIADVFQA